jgi:DNA-binding NtrC family response regulator
LIEEKIQILIVDDESELLEVYNELFMMEGFEVFTALSAIEGMEIYKENRNIKLIISDSTMKKMTGLQFLKALQETYQTIPIFYLTTGGIEYTDGYIKSLGGHGFVLKPFDLNEILIKIRRDLNL